MYWLPIVLAGGEGRRLYPLSTPARPKPFIPLADGSSLLQQTLRRLPPEALSPLLMGRDRDRYALINHAREVGVHPSHILLEPASRNTGFAIAAAVRFLGAVGTAPETMLVILPSDHHIDHVEIWQASLARAIHLAYKNQALTLLGMRFESFSSQLGYFILLGDRIVRFLEKPMHDSRLTSREQWLVNSGQFVAPLSVMAQSFAEYAPAVWQAAGEAVAARRKSWEFEELAVPPTAFVPESFDHAVVSNVPNLFATLCPPCGWSDLGTIENWKTVTAIDMVSDARRPPRTDRPWGYYETLSATPQEISKRLHVFPGGRLSQQRHFQRRECWVVESGIAHVECDGEKYQLGVGEFIEIPVGAWHRLVNPSPEMLVVRETQLGQPSEYDIERREDDYGRS
jgi:mannose-1-phosphate guanylyltransferase/mannose-6-phosphate isomerase